MDRRTSEDEVENIRREAASVINTNAKNRTELETRYGEVWDTEQLKRNFDVLGFAAPLVVVVRRSDGCLGSLFFQHSPRFYFEFAADE